MSSGIRKAIGNLLLRQLPYRVLLRTRPVSTQFGFDRGLPIDRYYIEEFLSCHANDIQGRTLEIGDDAYTRRFGADRVTRLETLHIDTNEPATYHGDIVVPGVLPGSAYDCIVFTQTLHLIYDMQSALANLHASLKPGGVLLVTVPGITPIARDQWGKNWFWSLTPASLGRLCDDRCGQGQSEIESHGNVLAATAFLYGLATHEISKSKLDEADPSYPVIVTARVRRLAAHRAS